MTGPDLGSGNMEFDSPSLDVANERVILRLGTAEFLFESLQGVYDMLKDGMTQKQRAPYIKALEELKATNLRSHKHDSGSYFQDMLEELDDDY